MFATSSRASIPNLFDSSIELIASGAELEHGLSHVEYH